MADLSARELLQRHDIAFVETRNGKYTTKCPGCSEGYLNVKIDRERVAWFCHSCDKGGGEKFDQPRGNGLLGPVREVYDYCDENAKLLFQVLRFEPDNGVKQFRQRAGPEQEKWSIKGIRIVPFRLPELMEDLANEHVVFVVEGERDVLTLHEHGVPATCNPMGAGKWWPEFNEILRGADVVICGDNDEPGRDHVALVARNLAPVVKRLRVLRLATIWPDIQHSDDISDWFANGGTVQQLWMAIEQWPDYRPPESGNGLDYEPLQDTKAILPGIEFADLSTSSRKVWLVHHLLASGEISIWYGEPGSGKSVGIEDCSLHVAAGRLWHGRAVLQCAVVYVALERASVVERRAIAWGLEHGMAGARLPFKVVRGPLDFRDPKVAEGVVATLEDLARRYGCTAGLVVVDTVSRALCGGDENSPKDMGLLVANISRIQAAIDVHVAMTHHQPAEKERMRGHGALLGAADTTVHVTNGAIRLAEVVKSSDHEEGQRIAFTLKSVTIDQDDGFGDPVTAPVMVGEQMPTIAKAAKRATKVPKNAMLALNALHDALGDTGERVASNHVPAGAQTVTLGQWRDYSFRKGLGGDEPNSRSKAFARAVECLAGSGLVGVWEPYVWVAEHGGGR